MKHMERIPLSLPVNREARVGISRPDQDEIEVRKFNFQSRRRRVVDCPSLMKVPPESALWVGKRIGAVTVVGCISNIERSKVGWRAGGSWIVLCDCGVYENRHGKHVRAGLAGKHKRQYRDACTSCRGLWAEVVRKEFKETGIIPPGGLPTHKAFKVSESVAHRIRPIIRVKAGSQKV